MRFFEKKKLRPIKFCLLKSVINFFKLNYLNFYNLLKAYKMDGIISIY